MAIYAVEYQYDESLPLLVSDFRPAHREYLRGLEQDGVLIATGFLRDASFKGALMLLRAENAHAVEAILDRDPFSQNGLVHSVKIREWEPTLGDYAKGFDRSFPYS